MNLFYRPKHHTYKFLKLLGKLDLKRKHLLKEIEWYWDYFKLSLEVFYLDVLIFLRNFEAWMVELIDAHDRAWDKCEERIRNRFHFENGKNRVYEIVRRIKEWIGLKLNTVISEKMR
jgi:hypothetical protein